MYLTRRILIEKTIFKKGKTIFYDFRTINNNKRHIEKLLIHSIEKDSMTISFANADRGLVNLILYNNPCLKTKINFNNSYSKFGL